MVKYEPSKEGFSFLSFITFSLPAMQNRKFYNISKEGEQRGDKMFGNPYFYGQPVSSSGLMRPSINGRAVTSAEEAKAAQIELDGSLWYFPCPSENKIYVKYINMNGMPVFSQYILTETNTRSIEERLTNLENALKGMKVNEQSDGRTDEI